MPTRRHSAPHQDAHELLPAVLKRPGMHGPVQAADAMAGNAPYRPALHCEHALLPSRLHCPLGHSTAVALVEPEGHA